MKKTEIKSKWLEQYNLLKEYHDVNGHSYILKNNTKLKKLRNWLKKQCDQHKKLNLLPEEERLLTDLDVDFTFGGKQWSKWESHYDYIANLKDKGKDPNISQLKSGIGPWLSAQRVMYRQKLLKPGRIILLEKIGIRWMPSDNRQKKWMEQYNKLIEFKEKYGHCNVSRREFPNPGVWVSAQRTAKRKGILPQERIDLLEKIGFEWSLSGNSSSKN